MRTVYLNASYFPAVELLSAIGTAAILLYGGYQVIDGNIEIGVLIAFVGYLQTFFDPIQQISQLYTTYQQGMAALDKIFDLLDTEPDTVDRADAIDPGEIRGEIELEGVWFSYAEDNRLARARGHGNGDGPDGRRPTGWALQRHRPARSCPARPSRWSARPAPASRRWRSWSPASTTRSGAGSRSTASTSASSTRARCAASSGSSRRRASCSAARSRENVCLRPAGRQRGGDPRRARAPSAARR